MDSGDSIKSTQKMTTSCSADQEAKTQDTTNQTHMAISVKNSSNHHYRIFDSVYMLLLGGDGDSKAVCDPSFFHLQPLC